MDMSNLIEPDRVFADLRANDKTQLLQELARKAANSLELEAQVILGALSAREGLGSTGVGQGVAIPHARVKGLKHLFGLFARLDSPIAFAAVDDRPVDLVFLLLIPDDAGKEHLAALSCISRRLRDRDLAERLRGAGERTDLYHLLVDAAPRPAGPALGPRPPL
jgi:PTS system nitrogen regulatory IIA component